MKNNPTKILIVDDNPTNIDVLRGFLTNKSYLISAVTSGNKALTLIEKSAPDLILLDVMMPEIDGFTVCKTLKANKNTCHIPIIFVTAKTAPEDIKKGFQVGGSDYISKPAHEDEVLARVQNQITIIERHKMAQKILMETQKMSSLGSLVSTITHEVASPLGTLTLSLSVLNDAFTDIDESLTNSRLTATKLRAFIDKSMEATSIAHSNLNNALQILKSFKLIAVDQCSNAFATIDLKEYIESIVLSLRPILKKTSHQVTLTIPSELTLFIQPGALTQILTNLINNSLIHGFEHRESGTITISVEQTEHEVLLKYTDDGVGITPEIINQIFDEYFTTKKDCGGSGLGMSIVKKLTEDVLHGNVNLTSEVNHGVVFTMRFPKKTVPQ